MSEAPPATGFKPKKSVALSGVVAGNTAICTVGRSGNDLHYRGYDILDIAETCEFEEIAYLLIHEKLPNPAELAAYKRRLKGMRGITSQVRTILEQIPAGAHPMDVLRTGVSALGCAKPESPSHAAESAREVADRLVASTGSLLCYWHHFSRSGKRIDVETDDDSAGGHFLHMLHGKPPRASWVRAMHTSLILYAEHEFNASTFTARVIAGTGSDMHSCITGAIGALRGPKHGGANEVALEIQQRYQSAGFGGRRHSPARRGQGSDHRLRPSGLHDRGSAQRRHQARRRAAVERGRRLQDVPHRRAHRVGHVGSEAHVREPRLVQRRRLSPDGRADGDVHAALRDLAHDRLVGARHRAARGRQDHPPERELHRAGAAQGSAGRPEVTPE